MEDIENIVELEKTDGVVVQSGGQAAIKLTEILMKMGVPILGTSVKAAAHDLDYPVLVRSSYVPGGQEMQIASNDDDIKKFMEVINRITQERKLTGEFL